MLSYRPVSSSTLKDIKEGRLKSLATRSVSFTAENMNELVEACDSKNSTLTHLKLVEGTLTSGALEALSRCKKLRVLEISDNDIGAEGAKYLTGLLPNLFYLDISENSIGDDGFKALVGSQHPIAINFSRADISKDVILAMLDSGKLANKVVTLDGNKIPLSLLRKIEESNESAREIVKKKENDAVVSPKIAAPGEVEPVSIESKVQQFERGGTTVKTMFSPAQRAGEEKHASTLQTPQVDNADEQANKLLALDELANKLLALLEEPALQAALLTAADMNLKTLPINKLQQISQKKDELEKQLNLLSGGHKKGFTPVSSA